MKQIHGLLLLAAVVCLATSNFSGCGSSNNLAPGTSVVSKEEPNVTFKGLDGKEHPDREPERQSCTVEFLGHVVRTMCHRDSLAD